MPHEFETPPETHALPPSVEPEAHDAVPNAVSEAFAAAQKVTAEELQSALRALEGRPALPASGLSPDAPHVTDTLSIGEAADALGLSASPADLWREVQAQRVAREQPSPPRSGTPSTGKVPPPFQQVPPLQTTPQNTPNASFTATAQGRWKRWLLAMAVAFGLLHHLAHGVHHTRVISGTGPMTVTAGSDIIVNGDGESARYTCKGGTMTVSGDGNSITVDGKCGELIVTGDSNSVQMRGPVAAVVLNGDSNSVTYPALYSPSITDTGARNAVSAQ